MAGITGLAPMVHSGKLRLLAISSLKRQASFEGVPTIAETVPGFDWSGWIAFAGPPNLPAPVVELLAEKIIEAGRD